MSKGFKDFFSAQAAQYSKYRPHYPKELFKFLSKLTASHDRVWDCGTGNGQAAVGLAEFYSEVIATDPSEAQIKNAVPHPKVKYSIATAESVPSIANESVDLVTAAAAAHWFDLKRFYVEVNRVLKPNGKIALWTYGHSRKLEHEEVNEIFESFISDVIEKYWAPEIQWVREEYKTIHFPYKEISHPKFEVAQEMSLDDLLGYVSSWSATQKFIQVNNRNPLPELRNELEKVWGDPSKKYRVVWPVYMRVGSH